MHYIDVFCEPIVMTYQVFPMDINIADIHGFLMDTDRIPYLVAAILLSIAVGMITGPLAGNANPFIWQFLDRAFGKVGERMDRKNRKSSDLLLRGFMFCAVLLFMTLLFSRALSFWAATNSFVEIVVISLCLTAGSVWYMVLKLYFALTQQGKAEGGYFGLSRSSRVDLNSTDDYGITREGLSFSAVSFDKGLVAPAFWYLVGGMPFMLIYSTLSFAAWRYGKCGFTKGFGQMPLAMEKLMGFIPSLFSGFLYTAAAAVSPTAKILPAMKSWWATKDQAPYEQGGLILSALAWPLDVSLGGPVQDVSGSSMKKTWVGPKEASAKIEAYHLKRGIMMNVMAHFLFVLALLFAYIMDEKLF